jgi:iron complex outermembrane recepter protein
MRKVTVALEYAAAGGFVALLIGAPAVQAQELEEVTVTATRSAESIEKVPVSVTAFTSQQMEEQHLETIDDLSSITPGLQFHRSTVAGAAAGVTVISIRGIESNIGDGTTGIYIDDTPVQTRRAGLSFTATNPYPQLFDIDRVEVLRGPQGTLFGAGSMGGAVRFITTAPNLTSTSLYTHDEISYTEHGDPNAEASLAFGTPIVDDVLGFRFSARFRRDGGYVDAEDRPDLLATQQRAAQGQGTVDDALLSRNVNFDNISSVRLALEYAPTENLHITPSVMYQDVYYNNDGAYWDYYSNPSQGTFLNADMVNSPFTDRWTLGALNVTYDVGDVSIIANSSYFDRTNTNYYDCTTCVIQLSPLGPQAISPTQFVPSDPRAAVQAHDLNQQLNWTQEIRAQSKDPHGRLTWLVGAFFQNEKASDQDFVPSTPAAFTALAQGLGAMQNPPQYYATYQDLFYGASLLNGNETYQTLDLDRERQIAGFADLTWEFIPGLKLTGGLRTTHLNLQATALNGGPFAGTSSMGGFSAGQSQTATTPRGSLSWDITDASMVYATAAKGFRGGGVNTPLPASCDLALRSIGLSSAPESYQSDSLISYELGTKNRLFDNRLELTGSVFYIKWSNIQQSVQLFYGCNNAVVLNANAATSKGFDLQGAFALSKAVTLNGSVSYTKAVYTQPLDGTPNADGVPSIIINKGDTLEGVVPWEATFGAAYTTTVLGHETTARLDYSFQSRQGQPTAEQDSATTSYLPRSVYIPQIAQLNARYAIKIPGGTEVAAFVTNVFDAHPSIQIAPGDQFSTVTESTTIRPRTFGASLTYRY